MIIIIYKIMTFDNVRFLIIRLTKLYMALIFGFPKITVIFSYNNNDKRKTIRFIIVTFYQYKAVKLKRLRFAQQKTTKK